MGLRGWQTSLRLVLLVFPTAQCGSRECAALSREQQKERALSSSWMACRSLLESPRPREESDGLSRSPRAGKRAERLTLT